METKREYKTYELVGADNPGVFDTCKATSFDSAKRKFRDYYSGDFRIFCTSDPQTDCVYVHFR
jgi:hypothetical protein